jgi:hypothetical protein
VLSNLSAGSVLANRSAGSDLSSHQRRPSLARVLVIGVASAGIVYAVGRRR